MKIQIVRMERRIYERVERVNTSQSSAMPFNYHAWRIMKHARHRACGTKQIAAVPLRYN